MKTEVRTEFILEAHKYACSEWKLKIEKECPELFKNKSGWYKDKNKENKEWLAFKDFENNKAYGINANGNWFEQKIALNVDHNEYPATEEEVKEALINEAKKRGFKKGVKVKDTYFEDTDYIDTDNFNYYPPLNRLQGKAVIFNKGKWSEIISNPIEEKIKEIEANIENVVKEAKKQLYELKKQL